MFSEEPECDLHTLLQGSYRTGTLVYDSGDVDILAINEEVYHSNTNSPFSYQQEATATYGYSQFRNDVGDVLKDEYGTLAVNDSDGPAIEVDSDRATGIPLDADVVPVLRYRYYTEGESYEEGVCFYNESELTFNFPEQHISVGEELNSSTDGEYNKTVRLFKNARNKLVNENALKKSTVPSYFIECLLSNVSEEVITTEDLQDRYLRIIGVWVDAENGQLTPQHDVADRLLFGNDPQQWNVGDFVTGVEAFHDLYQNWEDHS